MGRLLSITTMQEQRKQLLSALLEKPTTYHIDVEDNSMMPDDLKDKKEFTIEIKPPSLATLAMASSLLQDLPKELLTSKAPNLQDALPHIDLMVKIICILSHRKDDYPEWHMEFIKANCTPKDIFRIFQEASMKMQSDFFLTSFQIAKATNPMMMRRRNASTLISL